MDDFHLCICQFREHYDERYDFTGLIDVSHAPRNGTDLFLSEQSRVARSSGCR
jgi:hypothetical protein